MCVCDLVEVARGQLSFEAGEGFHFCPQTKLEGGCGLKLKFCHQ